MDKSDLEFAFLNGSCAPLAKRLYEKYGYEIYHVFIFNKERCENDDETGIHHTMVKTAANKYLDIIGARSSDDVINEWYKNTHSIAQTTEIFLINDTLTEKIGRKNVQSYVSHDDELCYNFRHYLSELNYAYNGPYDLDDVCEFISVMGT